MTKHNLFSFLGSKKQLLRAIVAHGIAAAIIGFIEGIIL